MASKRRGYGSDRATPASTERDHISPVFLPEAEVNLAASPSTPACRYPALFRRVIFPTNTLFFLRFWDGVFFVGLFNDIEEEFCSDGYPVSLSPLPLGRRQVVARFAAPCGVHATSVLTDASSMYREPSVPQGTKNNAVKDPCAAARSSIRRQATIRRPSRYGSSPAWRNTATLRSPFPRPILEELEREAGGFTGLPLLSHSPAPIGPQSSGPFDLNSSLADNSRREAGMRILGDAARHSRPGQRLRIPRNPTLSDLNSRSSSTSDTFPRLDHGDNASFTPRFAPAGAYHRFSPPLSGPDVLRLSPMARQDAIDEESQSGPFMPLLRRVGQRSINDTNLTSRGPPIDGLGDRQRSVDVEDDHANNAWETLLTTMTADTSLPSADSSFTSASVSGTNRSHNNTSSSATSFENSMYPNAPPYPDYPNPCDYPSSSDSDTESDGEITQDSLFRRYSRRMRQVESMRRSHHLNSTMNNPPPIPSIPLSFSDSSGDPDLQNMQAILDRLARREDIPDDWWAAAGLSRTIGQREGAGDDLNDTRGPDGSFRES